MSCRQMFIVFFVIVAIGGGFGQKKAKDKCSDFVNFKYDSHITGGNKTSVNEFPHMVALGYGNPRNPLWLCGGTLISERFVLTAAHCTSLSNVGPVLTARLGTTTLNPRRWQNYADITISQTITHPDYDPPISYNDIALLKLERKVVFSRNILPACLNSASNINLATRTLLALGWGRLDFSGPTSEDLMKVRLRVMPNKECYRSYRGSSERKLPGGMREDVQLCAGGDSHMDTCQGDSGGPLEYKNGKFHYIVGITSFGKACGISRTPGVYTRVSTFVPWIESQIWR